MDETEPSRGSEQFDIERLTEFERERLALLLRGRDIRFVILTGAEAVFATTPGKAMLGIHVEALDGGRPTPSSAAIRNAWLLISAVPVVGPWLGTAAQPAIGWMIRQDAMNRGPHDMVASTVVVQHRPALRRRLVDTHRDWA